MTTDLKILDRNRLGNVREHITLYDTSDGHAVTVPAEDRIYYLAKIRPVNPDSKITKRWADDGKGGKTLVADQEVTPMFSEIPIELPEEAIRVAPDRGSKRNRRRGKRGRRK